MYERKQAGQWENFVMLLSAIGMNKLHNYIFVTLLYFIGINNILLQLKSNYLLSNIFNFCREEEKDDIPESLLFHLLESSVKAAQDNERVRNLFLINNNFFQFINSISIFIYLFRYVQM